MGRTNSTYRNHLDKFMTKFKPFKRGLREENKEFLDNLWEKAHRYSSAASYMNHANPGLPIMVSMMLGMQKEIKSTQKQLERLENQVDKLENQTR